MDITQRSIYGHCLWIFIWISRNIIGVKSALLTSYTKIQFHASRLIYEHCHPTIYLHGPTTFEPNTNSQIQKITKDNNIRDFRLSWKIGKGNAMYNTCKLRMGLRAKNVNTVTVSTFK